MPLTVTVTGRPVAQPGSETVVVAIFVTESVVRSATAAASRPASSAVSCPARAIRNPAATLSSGSRVPMIPVDRWSVCGTVVPSASASHPRDLCLVLVAGRPVAAFAEPLVEMTASAQPNPPRSSPEVCSKVRPRQPDGRSGEGVRREDARRPRPDPTSSR